MRNVIFSLVILVILFIALSFISGKNSLNKLENINPIKKFLPVNNVNNINNELSLNISSPVSGVVVNQSSIEVKGATIPNAAVFVNEDELKADSQGNFSANVILDEGENTIVVVANDDQGNFEEREINVTYNP